MSRDRRAALSARLLEAREASRGRPTPVTLREPLTAAPAPADAVLYDKGTASASGFRPSQWSFGGDAPSVTAPVPPTAANAAAANAPAVNAPGDVAAAAATETVVTETVVTETVVTEIEEAPARRTTPRGALVMAAIFTLIGVGALYLVMLSTPSHMVELSTPAVPPPPAARPAAVATAKPSPVAAPAMAVAAPAPPASDAAPAPDQLMARGDALLATGDIIAARHFYERAAELGSAAAARAAGKTYDPLFFEEAHVRGIRGEAAKAAQWYRQASRAGDEEAGIRLKLLAARYGA